MSWTPSIAIIGAGIGGICAAVQIQKQIGIDNFIIYEKEAEVGGTWWLNTYPGCACDVPSHVYSFSFAPNPNWTKKFSPAPEILEYLKGVVNSFDLRKYIKFNTPVIKADWIEEKQHWQLVTKHKDESEQIAIADILIIGTGVFSAPNIPANIVSKFSGQWTHSAQWKKDTQIANKSVAVIGSGASAIQIVPTIAPEVKELYVFQRTPAWVQRKRDYYYASWWKSLIHYIPPIGKVYRAMLFLRNELTQRVFQRTGTISNLLVKAASADFAAQYKNRIPLESMRKDLTPNYQIGCKRVILSDDYFETFQRKNVQLITDPIDHVEGNIIYSGDGTQTKVDTIVLATGFLVETFFAPMRLYGKGGVELLDLWEAKKPEAYYGINCHQFPNLFFLLGPNSGLGHNSIIFIIECQVNAVVHIIGEMMAKNVGVTEIKKEIQEQFNNQLQQDLKRTVWASGCKSWYYSEEKGNFTLWPFSCIEFWKQTRKITMKDFEVTQKK